ncbi:hypothetical protein ACOSQ3_027929 [Xanthoceras sorbifolium]
MSSHRLRRNLVSQASASRCHHRKLTSGYVAALLDKALCDDLLESVRKDIERVSKLIKKEQIQALLNDPFVGVREKGEVVKKVVKIGKVNRYLAGLVRMMIEKNKVGMVSEVLDEFERIRFVCEQNEAK